jgi:hypothetical protein
VNSSITERFWRFYRKLPGEVKEHARETYKLFRNDPYHPSLHFKRVHSRRPIFSVRINIDYRAVGIMDGGEIVWFWIGSHQEYDILIKRLRKT